MTEVPPNRAGVTETLGNHVTNPPNPSTSGYVIPTAWCEDCQEIGKMGGTCLKCGVPFSNSKEWLVSPCEMRHQGQFEGWVRKRARQTYMELMHTDPEEANALRSLYTSEYTAGMYDWEDSVNATNHTRTARSKPYGAMHLMFLFLKRCHPDITEKEATAICIANPVEWIYAYRWALGLSGNSQTSAAATEEATKTAKKDHEMLLEKMQELRG